MRYDTLTPAQIDRELRYCAQQLARTRSRDRRDRLARKASLLRAALERHAARAGVPSNGHGRRDESPDHAH